MSSAYTNEWSSGLCDCTQDYSSCCLTCWCPCVSFGRIAEILDNGQSSCCMMGCIFYLLNLSLHHTGLAWIVSMGYRTKLRRKYGIEGGGYRDCFTHLCCQPCALCQEYRELELHGIDPRVGWEGNTGRHRAVVTSAPPGEEMNR